MAGERIQDLPEDERPREKLFKLGPSALTDAELLAIFFRTGTVGRSAMDIGRELIQKHGSLTGVSRVTLEELSREKGLGPSKAAQLTAALELGKRLAVQQARNRTITTAGDVYEFLGPEMTLLDRESLRVVLLTTRLTLLRVEEISLGSINESVAHPREIFRPLIQYAAYAFILVHNHPSGDPSPSNADRQLTQRLSQAADLLQFRFLDHVIIGAPRTHGSAFYSFRESGWPG